jgi:hypothetical protein
MLGYIRTVFLLACTGGGIWGAVYAVNRISGGSYVELNAEAFLMFSPWCLLGAVVGLFLGAVIFPAKR